PFVGRTERDVAWTIEQLFHDEGADAVAFETIVAAGPNSARPHGRATDRPIGRGETIIVDTGCVVGGYVSDYTRTFTTGFVEASVKQAYAVVLAAQQAGFDALRSGVKGFDADAAARRVVDETVFAGTFGHGLGHGLGLEVHEAPRLSMESSDTVAAGNVVTVEPGIYLEGRAGIRIEDNIVVTEGGFENLTGFRKDLITVSGPLVFCAVAENVNTNQFKHGMHIELDGAYWRIVEFQHVKPGKGGAFVRTKLKGLDSGSVVDRTFRAGEKFARVRTETKEMQYLYDAGDEVVFMDTDTYEQTSLPHAMVEDALEFMLPSSSVQIMLVNGKPSGVQLPSSVELAVSETEPGVKGDTVSNVTKPATLETGAVVQVPLFVNPGERIKVDPREKRYISRA